MNLCGSASLRETFSAKLSDKLDSLPKSPGVYLFKDADGQILYVGKAKNLKKRGAQYLQRVGIEVGIPYFYRDA